MALTDSRRHPVCTACAGSTKMPGLCQECSEAFDLARRPHPSDAFGEPSVRGVDDDLDLWDAWSLLGDVGGRAVRCVAD